jgi:hypothetical protein
LGRSIDSQRRTKTLCQVVAIKFRNRLRSQRKRKRVEQSFRWMKMIGMLKKVKLRGIDKVGWLFAFTGAAYNPRWRAIITLFRSSISKRMA